MDELEPFAAILDMKKTEKIDGVEATELPDIIDISRGCEKIVAEIHRREVNTFIDSLASCLPKVGKNIVDNAGVPNEHPRESKKQELGSQVDMNGELIKRVDKQPCTPKDQGEKSKKPSDSSQYATAETNSDLNDVSQEMKRHKLAGTRTDSLGEESSSQTEKSSDRPPNDGRQEDSDDLEGMMVHQLGAIVDDGEANEPKKTHAIEKTSASQPIDESASKQKLKFEVVNSDGKLTLTVTSASKAKSIDSTSNQSILIQSPGTIAKRKVLEKAKPKRTKSSDKGKPQRSKSTDKPLGGKQRNKVMSPRSPMPGQQSLPQQKPLMDLRHILKKHEKKREPVQLPLQQPDFYGSMSAIPFLKTRKLDEKRTAQEQKNTDSPKQKSNSSRGGRASQLQMAKTEASSAEEVSDENPKLPSAKAEASSSEEVSDENPKLPSREEIVMTAEYDEAQLHLWKSMSALDSNLDSVERPRELLPLRPGVRLPKRKPPLPGNAVRAFSRPEDWLNRPQSSLSPHKASHRVAVTKKEIEDQILVMEPENDD